MFGKLTIEFEKASVVSAIAFVGASCACLMISNGLTLFIRGSSTDRWARAKGLVVLTCGLTLLAGSLAAVVKGELIVKVLTKYIESYGF